MFEDSLYNLELAEPTHEGDFLHNYEVKSWDIGPRVYKIIGASALVNILLIAIAGQGSVLTAKTCDSPLVGRVCQVLDTVYVGSMLFGTQREYVDVAYQKTNLGDADITFVDVSGAEPPLNYPAGYFQLANPEQFAMQQDLASNFIAPGIPNPTSGGLINQTPELPKPNANPVEGNLPSIGTDGDSSIATTRKGRRGGRINPTPDDSTTASTNTNTNTAGNPTVDPTDPVSPEDINKRPFKELADFVNDLIAKKEIDLEKTQFQVEATGKLNKEGKLEKKTFRYIKAVSSDPKMIPVVQKSIEAFNDSGFLKYLKDLSGKDLSFSVSQDQEKISAVVQSELERDTRAGTVANLLRLGVQFAQDRKAKAIEEMQRQNDPDKAADLQNEIDDLELLKNTKIETDGKKLIISFNVPKDVVQKMIQRKLLERAQDAKKEVKDEGAAPTVNRNDNTAKK